MKGFCFGLNKPLISINTLKVLSKSALSLINNKNSILCPMVDARRMEVFTKLYDCQLNSLSDDKSLVLDENSFDLYNDKEIYFFGNVAFKTNANNPAGIKPVVNSNPNLIPRSGT